MKRKLLVVFGVLLLLAVLSVPTLSYIVAQETERNAVTTGSLDFEIHEKTSTGEDFPREGVPVLPGDTVSKIVTFENLSSHPMYVRVQLIKRIEDEPCDDDMIELDINDEDWTFAEGFYYYNKAVEGGETTTPLFTEAKMAGLKIDNSFINKNLFLDVNISAVQAENNGDGPLTAIGWQDIENAD